MKPVKNASGVSGMLGKVASLRNVRGQVLVKNRTTRTGGKPKGKQLGVQEKFLSAARWAKAQVSNPDIRALYNAAKTDKKNSPYMVAMSDFLVAPTINSVNAKRYSGVIGDLIIVDATDDFKVTEVHVTIRNAGGTILEEGDAINNAENPTQWVYKATIANPALAGTVIGAIAYDRPGHEGVAEVTL